MSAGFAWQKVRAADTAPDGYILLGELVGESRRAMEFTMDGSLILIGKDSVVQVEDRGYYGRRSAVLGRWKAVSLGEAGASPTPRGALDSRRRQRECLARWRAANGPRETVDEFLARGGAVTRCPTVFLVPTRC